jgi:hypothetical protein
VKARGSAPESPNGDERQEERRIEHQHAQIDQPGIDYGQAMLQMEAHDQWNEAD